MCGMEDYADAIVGTLGVEQRKRTTIGVELAAKVQLSTLFQFTFDRLTIFAFSRVFFSSLTSPLQVWTPNRLGTSLLV